MTKSKKPFVLDVELTSVCNADCIMCPRDSLTRSMGFMSDETFEQLLFKVRETEATHVVFSGFGESGLHSKFVEYLRRLTEETACYTQLNTNGIILDKEMVDKLKNSGLNAINLNINATNDADYKEILPGKGRFEKVLSNVRYMVTQKREGWDMILKIQTSLIEDNSQELEEFKEFWFAEGIDELVVHPCNNRGGHYKGKFMSEREPVDKATAYCSFILFVAWNGDIFSCSHDLAGKFKLGEISNLEKSWTDSARIPLCDTCNIAAFKVIENEVIC